MKIERHQPCQDLLVGQVHRSAVGVRHGSVQFIMDLPQYLPLLESLPTPSHPPMLSDENRKIGLDRSGHPGCLRAMTALSKILTAWVCHDGLGLS
jgi:hypothetical protein